MRALLLPTGAALLAATLWHCQGFTAADDDAGVAPDAIVGPKVDGAPAADAETAADVGHPDAPPVVADASLPESSLPDANLPDTSLADASLADASLADAGLADADLSDGGACAPACGLGRSCCAGGCVNPSNDPRNCGGCGKACAGPTPFCNGGTCTATPCGLPDGSCPGAGSCCGSSCCGVGAICCRTEGPVATPPVCFTPSVSQPTCPQGCAPMCVSDRNLKQDVSPVDERAVLEAVGRMPVSTWSYTTDGARVRHIGPMAQDFHAAFGVGVSKQAYDPIDAHGVELASIKALYTLVQEQSARIDRLERENRELRERAAPREPTKHGPRRP